MLRFLMLLIHYHSGFCCDVKSGCLHTQCPSTILGSMPFWQAGRGPAGGPAVCVPFLMSPGFITTVGCFFCSLVRCSGWHCQCPSSSLAICPNGQVGLGAVGWADVLLREAASRTFCTAGSSKPTSAGDFSPDVMLGCLHSQFVPSNTASCPNGQLGLGLGLSAWLVKASMPSESVNKRVVVLCMIKSFIIGWLYGVFNDLKTCANLGRGRGI